MQIHVKMVNFEKPVLPMMAAVEVDPLHRAFGQCDFVRGVAWQRYPGNHRMFKSVAKGSFGAMKIAAGKFLFEWRGAYEHTIQFNGSAWRIAGEF